ncbi:MAG: hypothetical protein ACD_28C00401G0002 [uncultured bacterium]|nr:MAG: hypothetical protein ACD_28C00401G0002 [uncultured bacterium]KKT75980.1 MAG: hypothetical protein UW70_C0025G0028 [Candidatus Peregrinibacteria bacterium GW2011_GWA2_44_7]
MSFRFMRKPFVLVGLFFSLLGLTGCFGDSAPEDQEVSSSYATYEGEIQSLGTVKFSGEATHLLRMEDGTVIYLYSEQYDLSDESYQNRLLFLGGNVTLPENGEGKPIMEVTFVKFLEDKPTTEASEGWTIYSNEEMGFAFKHPSDWLLLNHGTGVPRFVAPGDYSSEPVDEVEIKALLNTENLSLEEWFNVYENDPVDPVAYELSAIGSKQIPALKLEDYHAILNPENGTTFYIYDGGRIFKVTYHSFQEEQRIEHAKLFSDMLYSFDVLSDGADLMESSGEEGAVDATDGMQSDTDTVDTSEYQEVVQAMTSSLKTLASSFDPVTATTYEFVESDYVYVNYVNDFNSEEGRILVRRLSGNQFETLATFKPGAATDWELISGTDEAKGKPRVLFSPASNTATPIAEGYRWFESPTYEFQLQYPSAWYYARSENFFYFNDEPIDAMKGLIMLEVLAPGGLSPEVDQSILVSRSFEDGTIFNFYGNSEYEEIAQVMADSVVREN